MDMIRKMDGEEAIIKTKEETITKTKEETMDGECKEEEMFKITTVDGEIQGIIKITATVDGERFKEEEIIKGDGKPRTITMGGETMKRKMNGAISQTTVGGITKVQTKPTTAAGTIKVQITREIMDGIKEGTIAVAGELMIHS